MTHPDATRRVAITGASGMIGGALATALRADSVQVVTVGRRADSDVRWDFRTPLSEPESLARLEGLSGFVHLAGSPIGRRWTAARKREIVTSRVDATERLSRALAALRAPPPVLASGSAVGIYGDRGDETLTEDSETGQGFLADTARAWEAAARSVEGRGVRVAHLRMGIVLTRRGGAVAELLLPFGAGVGGRLGDGRQWMSWILLDDVLRAIRFVLERDVRGPVNIVSPNPVTNAEFTRALGKAMSRPAVIPVPRFGLKLLFGEMAEATLLSSQRVLPGKLIAGGFAFSETEIGAGLARALET